MGGEGDLNPRCVRWKYKDYLVELQASWHYCCGIRILYLNVCKHLPLFQDQKIGILKMKNRVGEKVIET